MAAAAGGPRLPAGLVLTTFFAILGLLGLSPVRLAAAASPVPGDYRPVAWEVLTPGVEHLFHVHPGRVRRRRQW
jgi:hypothetical protein